MVSESMGAAQKDSWILRAAAVQGPADQHESKNTHASPLPRCSQSVQESRSQSNTIKKIRYSRLQNTVVTSRPLSLRRCTTWDRTKPDGYKDLPLSPAGRFSDIALQAYHFASLTDFEPMLYLCISRELKKTRLSCDIVPIRYDCFLPCPGVSST